MDHLFKLAKSLQKSEKRFFRLFAARHVKGRNNSLLLFDAIAIQKEYDEKDLRKIFQGTSISKHFAFNKQYLYRLLLKALHHYYSHSSAEEIIKEQMHHIKILFDRRLLDACDKLIDKTIVLAKKYEANHELVRLWELKLEVVSARLFRGYQEKDMLHIETEMKSALANLSGYMQIYAEQRKLYFHAETRGIMLVREQKEKYLKMEKEIKHIQAEGFRSAIYKEHFSELVNRNLSGDRVVTEKNIQKILGLIRQYPHMIKEAPREYLTTAYNYGIHKLYARDNEKAQEMANELRSFTNATRLPPGLQYASLHFHAILQIGIYRNMLQYAEAERYFADFRKKEKKFEGMEQNISRMKVIYYAMSGLCFVTGNYKPAIGYLSKITSARLSNERTDLDDYARIMQLLSFFAIGNTLSLERLAGAVRKTFAKKKNLLRIEKLVLDFVMKNNRRIHEKTFMKEKYEELLKELRNISESGTNEEKIALEYIDLLPWVEAQLRK